MYSPHKRRESERESSTSYFSAFSPRSRNGSTLGPGNDAGSPLTRLSPLSALDGTPRDTTPNQHPLALELQSLRTSLGKFQHVAHKTSMQLQGKAMEVVMVQDEAGRLSEENKVLKEELEVLRRTAGPAANNTSSGTNQDPISALSELSLAHRRLCAKMDASEENLHHANTSLSQAELENERMRREIREMNVLGGQWRRRIEEERESVQKERLARRQVEEKLKICELALAEYQQRDAGTESVKINGILRSDTSPQDTITTMPNACPSCAARFANIPATTYHDSDLVLDSSTHLTSTPSNILLGIQGLQRLFAEFQTALVEKEGRIACLENEAEVHVLKLQTEREMVKKAIEEKEEMRRDLNAIKADDESASKVVERYMAFTQKTTQHQHSNFQSQTTRLNQTINTLRHQLLSTQTLLDRETARTAQLRQAIDELAEGFERETFGRRREVTLRMRSLEREDRRLEAGRRWAEKVRRERSRLGGVADAGGTLTVGGRSVGMTRSVSPMASPSKSRPNNLLRASPSSTSLASMTSNAVNPYEENRHLSTLWDLLESGIELFAEEEHSGLAGLLKSPGHGEDMDDQTARDVLVQDLHDELMRELGEITVKNINLERQRLEWIASGTIDCGFGTEGAARETMTLSPVKLLPALPQTSDDPATRVPEQYLPAGGLQLDLGGTDAPPNMPASNPPPEVVLAPLMQCLHDTAGRFSTLQKQLADCAASVSALRDCQADMTPAYCSTLQILLDGITDVIEDVRVEVEIAIADDERDLEGHRTLLKLKTEPAVISKASDFADSSHIAVKAANFAKRLCDVEHDLVGIKVALSELQAEGREAGSPNTTDQEVVNPLLSIPLKTVRAPAPPSRAAMQQRQLGNGLKRGFFGGLSRTLSGTTSVLPLSRASSVSQHSPLAEHAPAAAGSSVAAVQGQDDGHEEARIDDVE